MEKEPSKIESVLDQQLRDSLKGFVQEARPNLSGDNMEEVVQEIVNLIENKVKKLKTS